MRTLWQLILSATLGFLGGVVAIQVLPRLRSVNESSTFRVQTVRASRFELTDGSGNVLAYWGRDAQSGRILITFLDEAGASRAEFGLEPSQVNNGTPSVFTPFTALLGPDGKIRLQARLDRMQDPFLAMGDSHTEGRMLLGHFFQNDMATKDVTDPWDKWSLIFRNPADNWKDYLDIGATTPLDTKQRSGYILLSNSLGRRIEQMPR